MHEPVFWKKFHHFQQKSHPIFTLSRNLISSSLLLFAQILTSFKSIIASLTSCNVSHTKRPLLTSMRCEYATICSLLWQIYNMKA